MIEWLDKVAPPSWKPPIVPVTAGQLDLGPWQQVFYCEFDGGRPKRVVIKAIGQ